MGYSTTCVEACYHRSHWNKGFDRKQRIKRGRRCSRRILFEESSEIPPKAAPRKRLRVARYDGARRISPQRGQAIPEKSRLSEPMFVFAAWKQSSACRNCRLQEGNKSCSSRLIPGLWRPRRTRREKNECSAAARSAWPRHAFVTETRLFFFFFLLW